MEYTVQKLGLLAGVSTRTLRYYDEIGIRKPARINNSGQVRGAANQQVLSEAQRDDKGRACPAGGMANEILQTLVKAMETKDPAGELAQKTVELHRQSCFIYEGNITKKQELERR